MIAKYASVVAGSELRNQLRVDWSSGLRDGRTSELINALANATSPLAVRLATACATMFAGSSGLRSGKRSPSRTITGVKSAQAYHCGASPRNARQSAIGRCAIDANITVSSVERATGTVQITS